MVPLPALRIDISKSNKASSYIRKDLLNALCMHNVFDPLNNFGYYTVWQSICFATSNGSSIKQLQDALESIDFVITWNHYAIAINSLLLFHHKFFTRYFILVMQVQMYIMMVRGKCSEWRRRSTAKYYWAP